MTLNAHNNNHQKRHRKQRDANHFVIGSTWGILGTARGCSSLLVFAAVKFDKRCSSWMALNAGATRSPTRSAQARRGRPAKGSEAAARSLALSCGTFSTTCVCRLSTVGILRSAPSQRLKDCTKYGDQLQQAIFADQSEFARRIRSTNLKDSTRCLLGVHRGNEGLLRHCQVFLMLVTQNLSCGTHLRKVQRVRPQIADHLGGHDAEARTWPDSSDATGMRFKTGAAALSAC